MKIIALTTLLCCSAIAAAQTDTKKIHPKVVEALNYQLPINDCEAPRILGAKTDVVTPEGATQRYDVDTNQLERFRRKENRWKKCVTRYKSDLIKDFNKLKNSAQYGITQSQADTILGHMATIQTALESLTEQP